MNDRHVHLDVPLLGERVYYITDSPPLDAYPCSRCQQMIDHGPFMGMVYWWENLARRDAEHLCGACLWADYLWQVDWRGATLTPNKLHISRPWRGLSPVVESVGAIDRSMPHLTWVKFQVSFPCGHLEKWESGYPPAELNGVVLLDFLIKKNQERFSCGAGPWCGSCWTTYYAKTRMEGQMREAEVVKLMESSKSETEWNANCTTVKKAFQNRYPSFWWDAIVKSGVAAKVAASWGK